MLSAGTGAAVGRAGRLRPPALLRLEALVQRQAQQGDGSVGWAESRGWWSAASTTTGRALMRVSLRVGR
ncbi:hypothetical protein ASE03_32570 [Kitasatospora sp. Root187]|nr:hypothetical protein ASC99_29225 [Kitasatospora sp. Root107]KRB65115.1 hypothetical protein ASE03_32570 [Kitasatospora sp. Root187]